MRFFVFFAFLVLLALLNLSPSVSAHRVSVDVSVDVPQHQSRRAIEPAHDDDGIELNSAKAPSTARAVRLSRATSKRIPFGLQQSEIPAEPATYAPALNIKNCKGSFPMQISSLEPSVMPFPDKQYMWFRAKGFLKPGQPTYVGGDMETSAKKAFITKTFVTPLPQKVTIQPSEQPFTISLPFKTQERRNMDVGITIKIRDSQGQAFGCVQFEAKV